ncbi:MAG: bifunctional DNA primase/polymerase [Chloroflexia bacterium]|nr:bifunctional DNA primase/polymerase [Chloroflexia bacterium]
MVAAVTTNRFHAAALDAGANGICAIPSKMDGSKAPFGLWKRFQDRLPTEAEHDGWFSNGLQTGIFVVCGSVSGRLEMFEAESPDLFAAYTEAAGAVGIGPLWRRVTNGYTSGSPGGSRHVMWRCIEIEKNTVLAAEPLGEGKRRILFETRGEGGGSIEPPSNGSVHPSGGCYEQISGGFGSIASLTAVERADLLALARSFSLEAPEPPREPKVSRTAGDSLRPGDDFNDRADLLDLMVSHGWTRVFTRSGVDYLRRPGKSVGVSATHNHAGSELLWVFTSSTAFEPNKSYTAFGAYAVLEHAGNFAEAARALREQGYGPKLRLVSGANGPPPPPTEGAADDEPARPQRPEIDAADQHLERISEKVWRAVEQANQPPRLFNYGGLPVRIAFSGDDGAPVAQPLNEDRLSHEAARAATFYKDSERDGRKHAAPPMRVVRDMLAAPEFPFPVLVGITEAPTFAADGTLPEHAGYHPSGRTYFAPARGFSVSSVPDAPSPGQIERARGLIVDDLMGDFPFVGEAERAHAVAMVLLPLLRGLIAGPTPLHLIEKPSAGTGASLLADVVARIATGRPVGAMTEGRDEDEWRKRITAKLRGGPPLVLIDNLRRRLDSAVVSSVLTANHVEDRILGTSDNVRIPVRCVWVASGNNPALSSEITRRTVRIRLDAKRDRPWLRESFRHFPLSPWVMQERAGLVAACLTLGRAWIAEGRPVPDDSPILGSFEDWSHVMAGVLAVAGVGGFLSNLSEFYEVSDTEGAGIRAFLASWWETHRESAVGVADLFSIATMDDSALDLGEKGERSQKTRLGRMLGDLRDRQYQLDGGPMVRVSPAGTEKRAQLWRLVAVGVGDGQRGERSERGERGASAPAREATPERDGTNAESGGERSSGSPRSPDLSRCAVCRRTLAGGQVELCGACERRAASLIVGVVGRCPNPSPDAAGRPAGAASRAEPRSWRSRGCAPGTPPSGPTAAASGAPRGAPRGPTGSGRRSRRR